MAANLPGSGTQEDPYLISKYEDFSKMDSLETGGYYKLVKDINMIGRQWSGVNLNGGYLDLSDRKIENVDIADGSFCFYAGTIYAEREEWYEGEKIKENKAGYILNITGNRPEFIFKNIDFIRIGWSVINISATSTPINRITGLESYFWISNLNYQSDPFILLHRVGNNEYSLCDCVVSINGNLFDNYIVQQDWTSGDMQWPITVNRCLITGKVKTLGANARYSRSRHNGVLVNCACISTIIDIEHDPETYDGPSDWHKSIWHASYEAVIQNRDIYPDNRNGVSLYIASPDNDGATLNPDKPGIFINQCPNFVIVTKSQLLNSSYLKSIRFNVVPENQG